MRKFSIICLMMLFVLVLFCNVSMARISTKTVTKSVTAAGQWTDQISPIRSNEHGYMNIRVATVTLQRSFDSAVTWVDIRTWTANYQGYLVDLQRGVRYRIGVAALSYTSGTVVLRLSN